MSGPLRGAVVVTWLEGLADDEAAAVGMVAAGEGWRTKDYDAAELAPST